MCKRNGGKGIPGRVHERLFFCCFFFFFFVCPREMMGERVYRHQGFHALPHPLHLLHDPGEGGGGGIGRTMFKGDSMGDGGGDVEEQE
jgi:hypothetical protein